MANIIEICENIKNNILKEKFCGSDEDYLYEYDFYSKETKVFDIEDESYLFNTTLKFDRTFEESLLQIIHKYMYNNRLEDYYYMNIELKDRLIILLKGL